MNFLAHIYLSGSDVEIRLGNLLGEYVKGRLTHPRNDFLSEGMKKGVQMHRMIDSFTDAHPVVRHSIDRLQPQYHRYSGIAVDMFYDHFLAKHWHQFSDVPLKTFSQEFYQSIEENRQRLPPEMERMLNSMIQRDWFGGYAQIEGIEWALAGIAKRTKFESGLETAAQALRADYEAFEQDFFAFFPDLQKTCGEW